MVDINELSKRSENNEKITKKFFGILKKKKPHDLDKVTHTFHNEVFLNINCLDCANCCRSISPILNKNDITRMAKALKLSYSDFFDNYIKMDEEDDYIFQKTPCPFLQDNNYCLIYESRPKACREYPHTDRKNILQTLSIMQKNRYYCPAVFEIVEKLKTHFH